MSNGWYYCKKCDAKFCLDKSDSETIDDYWKRVKDTNRARCKRGHICDPCGKCGGKQD